MRRAFCALLAVLLLGMGPVQNANTVVIDPQIAAMLRAVSPSDLKTIDSALVSFGTRNLFSENETRPHRGVFAARDWIRAQFTQIAASSGGRMTVALDEYTQPKTDYTPRAVLVSSVIATLRGDEPGGRTYVMSSHYDSRNSDGNDTIKDAPGADDNGSGTTAVLEAAKVMASHHFAGTIIFACYDGEEQGLFGSAHHAKMLHDAGVPVFGDLNNDIMGASRGPAGSKPYDVRLFSLGVPPDATIRSVNLYGMENDSTSRELARFVKAVGEAYVKPMHADLIFRSDRFRRGGDQQSFQSQNFAAVRFVEASEDYRHQHQDVRIEGGVQYGDLQPYMDFDYLARVTRMNVAALAELATAPATPSRVELVNRQYVSDTTLRWNAVPGASSYEVVWRDTTSPVWEHAQNVGNVTEATVNVNHDNTAIGLRAVDQHGHRSPVTFPTAVVQ